VKNSSRGDSLRYDGGGVCTCASAMKRKGECTSAMSRKEEGKRGRGGECTSGGKCDEGEN